MNGIVRAVRACGGRHHGRAFCFNSRRDRIYDQWGRYGSFVPQGVDGLLIMGRCASCDHLMASASRRTESSFQSRKVGGTAAALAAKRGILRRQLPVQDLKAEHQQQGFKASQADRRA